MTNSINLEIKIDAEYIASNYDIKEKAKLPGGHHFHFYPSSLMEYSDTRRLNSEYGGIAYETPLMGSAINQYTCYSTLIEKTVDYAVFRLDYRYGGSYGHGDHDTRYIKVIF